MTGARHTEEDRRTLDAVASTSEQHRRLLLKDATVISMDRKVGDFERADILIEGRKIAAVAPGIGDSLDAGSTVIVDASGSIAIPGLQDAHRHCWQTQFRRSIGDGSFADYMALMHQGLAPHYRPEDIYLGTKVAGLTALDQGITTVLDFFHNCRSAAALDAVVAAWEDTGARAVIAPTQPLLADSDGLWREHLRALRGDRLRSDEGLVRLRLGAFIRAVPEIVVGNLEAGPDTLAFARDLGLGTTCDAVFGPHSSAHLVELGEAGLLGPDVTLIHCQTIDDAAWRQIAAAGCPVVLAASSDAQLGCEEAVPPIQQALDLGISPALSVDVECCLSSDLFAQMQVVLNTQRMHSHQQAHLSGTGAGGARPMPLREVLVAATTAGAKANGVDAMTGSLTPGKEADVVLIRADDINTMPLNDPIATVVLGTGSANVDKVLVAGRPRKWGGRLLDIDLGALRRELTDSRDHLLERIGKSLDPLDPMSIVPGA